MKKAKHNILAIIPARGGSKSITNKNIIPINGRPLIAYTTDAATGSNLITKTLVSSDSDNILDISIALGVEVLKRPAQLATDIASSESVITDTLNQLKNKGELFDIVVLLQPTSPLRDSEDIDNALQIMIDERVDSVISVVNIGVKPFKSYFLNKDGYLEGVHNNTTPNMRRQDLPDAYLANGAIYAIRTDVFLKEKTLLPHCTIPYVMALSKSVDIDTMDDVKQLEKILIPKN